MKRTPSTPGRVVFLLGLGFLLDPLFPGTHLRRRPNHSMQNPALGK